MLVVFRTESAPDITMFGDVAVKLLQMMGHSGTVPSALSAGDVPGALESLEAALAKFRAENPDDETVGDDFEGEELAGAHKPAELREVHMLAQAKEDQLRGAAQLVQIVQLVQTVEGATLLA